MVQYYDIVARDMVGVARKFAFLDGWNKGWKQGWKPLPAMSVMVRVIERGVRTY